MTTETTTNPRITIEDIAKINPLMGENGDTSKISAALDFVAWALMSGDDEGGKIELSAGPSFGLAVILESCSAALKEML